MLYFDRQYNDTFGLLHEDAYEDSIPLRLKGVNASLIDIRLLSPVDLAVAKLARFAENDQEDIKALAAQGLLTSKQLRKRAEEALGFHIGNVDPVRTSIAAACRMIDDSRPRR